MKGLDNIEPLNILFINIYHMKQLKQLKGLIPLSHNVKIYIPTTIDIDKVTNNTEQVQQALKLFSGLFGGSTSYNAKGAWNSQKGLVVESITIVESYCSESQLTQSIESVIDHAKKIKESMKQEAISLEVNNKLYFI